jgi:hypothetical protein
MNFLKNKWVKKSLISLLLGGVGSFILFYIFLPPINLQSVGFWVYLAVCSVLFAIPFYNIRLDNAIKQLEKYSEGQVKAPKMNSAVLGSINKWALIPTAACVLVILLGLLISSTLFNAKSYADIITVNDSVFSEDLPETSEITNIALMDTDTATILGNRTLGSLSNVVSQYVVSASYTQINYRNTPKKVSNLEYDGFFKWIGNRESGIPGMVMVDPVGNTAEYVELKSPIHYAESGYFGDDLERKLRFDYPTKIFDSISFEIDEEGNPYYVVACSMPRVVLFGASDITEVIIFDPTSGESELYGIGEVPSWVDIVYTGYLATEKYNWYGTLKGGFINSIIGNKGCTLATDDFGYIVIGDDVWYFTGVTSAVSDDKSNIGFIISNARTGEYKFYSVTGAEEHSAMNAAEGEVQEKGYVASFPSLVNIAGQPTYIMVLKDNAGLVKLYALVNVEQYSIVSTGTTQAEAISAYKKLLMQNGVDTDTSAAEVTVSVSEVRIATLANVATVYITASDGYIYKGYLEADEALITLKAGDTIKISYSDTQIDGLRSIVKWTKQ